MTKRDKSRIILLLIIVLYTAFLWPSFKHSPYESFNTWRQGDTYSIGRNFLNRDFNILRPQFFYDGPGTKIVQLELQLLTFLGAGFQKLFGSEGVLIYRIISYIFFLASGLYLFKISLRHMGEYPAVFGIIVYFLMPLSIEYSRSIMPETLALFFYLGSIYYIQEWYYDDRNSLIVSAIFMSLAISQKIPVIFTGLLILSLFFRKEGKKVFKNKNFYIYGLISLLPSLIYFVYMGRVSSSNFVSGIASKHILSKKILSIFTKDALRFFYKAVKMRLGFLVVIISFLGFIRALYKKNRVLIPWTLAFILELVSIVAIIKFDYYLVFILPLIAILVAYFLDGLRSNRKVFFTLSILIILAIFVNALDEDKVRLAPVVSIEENGNWIKEHTKEDELIAVNVLDPSTINASERNGYRMGIDYYDAIPRDPEGEINYYLEKDVDLFYLIKNKDYEKFLDPLEKNCKKYYEDHQRVVFIQKEDKRD